MKRLLIGMMLASLAAASDLVISGRGPYQDLARNVAWGTSGRAGVHNAYLFTPIDPSQGICIFVRNNNPTGAKTLNLSVFQTGDPETVRYTGDTGRWVQDTVQGWPGSVAANATSSAYVHTSAAARIAVVLSGSSAGGGSPDTADIFVVQTSHTSCGPVGTGAQYVQGSVAAGSAATGTNPVLTAGIDGSNNVRTILTDTSGRPQVNVIGTAVVQQGGQCGTAVAGVSLQAVPTSATDALTATSCLWSLFLSNTTAAALTVNVRDRQGTPVNLLNAFSIPANSALLIHGSLVRMISGINWSASGAGVTGAILAYQ